MLLPITEIELNARSAIYAKIFSERARSTVVVSRSSREEGHVSSIGLGEVKDSNDLMLADSGRAQEWAHSIECGESFLLYVAFHEDWRKVPKNASSWERKVLYPALKSPDSTIPTTARKGVGEGWIFNGAGLRFYIQPCDGGNKGGIYLWLRCDWEAYRFVKEMFEEQVRSEGKDADPRCALIFDGRTAAHPHFHFDSIHLNSAFRKRVRAITGPGMNFESFSSPSSSAFPELLRGVIDKRESHIPDMHLPIMAPWKKAMPTNAFSDEIRTALSPLPHQNYPATTEEIENWFEWCLNYFSHQFLDAVADK